MRKITIKNKSIPANPRSDNYPAGSTVIRSGNGSTTIIGGGSGSPDIDILRTTDNKSATDRNVFSALRACAEFISKKANDTVQGIIDFTQGIKLKSKSITDLVCSGEETELSNSNILSSSKTVEVIEQRAISRLRDDTTAGHITFEKGITTLNLLVQELAYTYDLQVDHVATLFQTIIKDFVSSETFVPGMTGEGMKLYKALSGDWNLELDNVTVRKAITTFEMVIAKIRAVNGGLVVSAANGSVKSVSETTGDPAYYVLGIEGDMTFVSDDLVRCQVFTSGRVKHYWLPIEQINGDSILLLKSGFPDGVTPTVGDELVQMGNRTDTRRQGVLYLTASEDGRPRFSVLDGINSPSLDGKNNTVLGCLDGITDADLPADFQPSGYGLYSMNVFLKGIFILRNGKSIEQALTELSTQIEAIPGQISMKVTEEVGKMQIGGRNYYGKSTPIAYLYGTPQHIERLDSINGLYLIGESGGNSAIRLQHAINSNGLWTVSFDIKGTQGTNGLAFRLDVCDNPEVTTNRVAEVNLTADNEYHHHEYTFNVQNYSSNVYNFVDFENLGWLFIYVRNLKIEKGNKATDWTPAPEDIETRMSQAELSLKPENIWLGIKSNVQASTVPCQTINIDARGLDENMYYPVIIHIPNAPMTTITLHYALEGVKPSWATHESGFSVQIRWTTNGGGWGTIGVQRIIHEATQNFANGYVAGNIDQIIEYSKEYIYVRGGGFYRLTVEGTEISPHTGLYPNGYQEGGDPYVRRIDPISTVTFPVASIPAIVETGIDISNRKIVLSADKTVFRNNSGGQIAVFENDRIKADLIDARQIVVNGLNAGRISTGNLEVTNGAKIGDWTIEGGSIVSRNTASAKILVEPSGTRFLRINDNPSALMNIRADGVTGISVYTQDMSGTCISMTAQTGGSAIRSYGNHWFNARPGESIYFSGCVEMAGLCLKTQHMSGGQIGDHDVFIRMVDTSYDPTLTLPYPSAIGRIIFICTRNRRIYIKGGSKYIRRDGSLRDQVDVSGADRIVMFIYDGAYWSYGWFNN